MKNAQEQTINKPNLKAAQTIKGNLEKLIKRRKQNTGTLCRHVQNPTDKIYQLPNLEQRELAMTNSSKILMIREQTSDS